MNIQLVAPVTYHESVIGHVHVTCCATSPSGALAPYLLFAPFHAALSLVHALSPSPGPSPDVLPSPSPVPHPSSVACHSPCLGPDHCLYPPRPGGGNRRQSSIRGVCLRVIH